MRSYLVTFCSVALLAACGSTDKHRTSSGSDGGPDATATGGASGTGGNGQSSTGGAAGAASGTGGVANRPDAGTDADTPDASDTDASDTDASTTDAGGGGAGGSGDAGGAGGAAPVGPGTLEIDLTNAALGGDVTISGPGDYSTHVTTSTTLTGLSAGTYYFTSKDVIPGDGGVVSKANPASTRADVSDTQGAVVSIDYGTAGITVGKKGLPPGLWFTGAGTPSRLVGLSLGLPTGNFNADVIYDLNPQISDKVQFPTAMAFDAKGGLWLADSLNNAVERIAASPNVTGALGTIDLSSSNVAPYTLAFDKDGNLWVAGQNMGGQPLSSKVLGFSAADLDALSQPVSPKTTYSISGDGNSESMVFDGSGYLWMAFPYYGSAGRFKPGLYQTGAANLTFVQDKSFDQNLPNGSNADATGLAFDAKGNLWMTNKKANEVVGYSAVSLKSASPGPGYHITLPTPMVNGTWGPDRLVVDPCTSELYVLTVTSAAERIFRYDVSDPTNPVLEATITCASLGIWTTLVGMAANPIPPGMPLYAGFVRDAMSRARSACYTWTPMRLP